MRNPREIQRAIDHLKESLSGAYTNPDLISAAALHHSLIKALEWVLGSDAPGDFGDMLKELEQVGEPRKPS